MTDDERKDAMQRNRERNERLMDQHRQVFDGLITAGFRIVKVAAPLWQRQESGQWSCIDCACASNSQTRKQDGQCHSIGKHPMGNEWQKHSTNSWFVAGQWLKEGYNLGAFVPPSVRAMAVDADREGIFDLMFPEGLPDTMGDEIGGKRHLMFTVPDGVDLDSIPRVFDGGEVSVGGSRHLVAPLGLHPRGGRKWNGKAKILPIPPTALIWLQQSKRQQSEQQTTAKTPKDPGWLVQQGGRHPWLASMAGSLRNTTTSHANLLRDLRELNEVRCQPPIDDADVVRLAKDYWDNKEGLPAPITLILDAPTPEAAQAAKQSGLVIKRMSSFNLRETHWLWQNWLPREEPILLEGMSAVGKSTFAMDIVARLTMGDPMPDGSPSQTGKPMRVLYITTEDDPSRILLPRAIASGADPSMIEYVTSEFTMPENAQALLDAIRSLGNVGLVLIDPLFSHVGVGPDGKTLNPNADVDMRRYVMNPLREICRLTSTTILLARHLNKSTMMDVNMRGSGSYGGLTGASRGVILVAKDPKDETGRDKVVGPLKIQYSAIPDAMKFKTWGTTVTDPATGGVFETSVVSWLGSAAMPIEEYLNDSVTPTVKATDKREALDARTLELLDEGCVPSAEFLKVLSDEGWGTDAVKASRQRMGVIAHQHNPQEWHVRVSPVACTKVVLRGGPQARRPLVATPTPPEAREEPKIVLLNGHLCRCGAALTPFGGCDDTDRHKEWAKATNYGAQT